MNAIPVKPSRPKTGISMAPITLDQESKPEPGAPVLTTYRLYLQNGSTFIVCLSGTQFVSARDLSTDDPVTFRELCDLAEMTAHAMDHFMALASMAHRRNM